MKHEQSTSYDWDAEFKQQRLYYALEHLGGKAACKDIVNKCSSCDEGFMGLVHIDVIEAARLMDSRPLWFCRCQDSGETVYKAVGVEARRLQPCCDMHGWPPDWYSD